MFFFISFRAKPKKCHKAESGSGFSHILHVHFEPADVTFYLSLGRKKNNTYLGVKINSLKVQHHLSHLDLNHKLALL